MALTDQQVMELRQQHATGEWSHRQLAELHDIAQSSVTDLVNGKTRLEAGGPVNGSRHYSPDLPNDPPDDRCEVFGAVVFRVVGQWPDGSPRTVIELADPEAGGKCGRSNRSAEHHLVFRGAGGVDDPTNTARVCQWHHDRIHLEVDEDSEQPRWFWNPDLRILTDPKMKQYVLTRDIVQELEQTFRECSEGLEGSIQGLNAHAIGIVWWLYRFLVTGAWQAGDGYSSVYELAAEHGMTNQSTVKGYLSTAHAYFDHLGLDINALVDRRFSYRDLKNAAASVKKLPRERALQLLDDALDPQGHAIPGALVDQARELVALPEKTGMTRVHVSGNFNVAVDCDIAVEDGQSGAEELLRRFRGHQWVTGTDDIDEANLVTSPAKKKPEPAPDTPDNVRDLDEARKKAKS